MSLDYQVRSVNVQRARETVVESREPLQIVTNYKCIAALDQTSESSKSLLASALVLFTHHVTFKSEQLCTHNLGGELIWWCGDPTSSTA